MYCSYALAILCALALAGCAQTVQPPPVPAEHRADAVLSHFDLDKDERLSKDEFTHGVISTFHYTDQDRSLSLHKHELGERWNAESEGADSNDDQEISLHEALKNGEAAFHERDTNGDGYLDREEIIRSAERRHEQGRQQAPR